MSWFRVARYLASFVVSATAVLAACLFAWPAHVPDPWRPRRATPSPVVAEHFSAGRAMAHLRALAVQIGPRPKGSAAERAAFEYCAAKLRGAGWRVRLQKRIALPTPGQTTWNLGAEAPGGSGKGLLILGAHVDSAGWRDGSRGAVDNASGVATLLELARACEGRKWPFRLRIVLFGAEEHTRPAQGIWHIGSPAYVRALPARERERCLAMLSVDAVAGAGPLYAIPPASCRKQPAPTADRPAPHQALAQAARRAHVRMKTRPGMDNSDHVAFAAAGMPCAWVTRLEGRPLWDNGRDQPGCVKPADLGQTGRVLLAYLEFMAEVQRRSPAGLSPHRGPCAAAIPAAASAPAPARRPRRPGDAA